MNGDVQLSDLSPGAGRSTFTGGTSFFSTPGIDFGFATNFGIPVGLGNIRLSGSYLDPAGLGIPNVAAEALAIIKGRVYPEIDRRDVSPAQELLSLPPGVYGPAQEASADLGDIVNPLELLKAQLARAGSYEEIQLIRAQINAATTTEDDTMDLGDVYDIIDTGLGGILPGGVPFGSSFPATIYNPPSPVVPLPYDAAAPAIPMASAVPGLPPMPPCPTRGPKPVLKFYCGRYQWIYPKRRGRKQLFTARDSVQLGNLIGIVGNGALAKTWIATHS